jgi:hypothetical protein
LILVRDFRAHRSGARSFNRVEARIEVSIIEASMYRSSKNYCCFIALDPTVCDIQHKMGLSTDSFGLAHISAV